MRIQVSRLSKQEGIDSNHTYVWCTDLIPDSSCQYDTRIFILAPITNCLRRVLLICTFLSVESLSYLPPDFPFKNAKFCFQHPCKRSSGRRKCQRSNSCGFPLRLPKSQEYTGFPSSREMRHGCASEKTRARGHFRN